MKLAAVEAIAELARMEASEVVARAYGGTAPVFGPDYIIPKPFDPRLILQVAPAVARAAMRDRGGAAVRSRISPPTGPSSSASSFRSGQLMRPVFEAARKRPARIVYSEGEDERVLRAVQTVVDEGIAQPVLIGRLDEIARRVREMGLRIKLQGGSAEPVAGLVRARSGARPRRCSTPLVAPYQRLVGTPGRAAGRRRQTHRATGTRWRPPCCCRPDRWTRPSVAAPATGGARWTMLLPIIPKRSSVSRIYALFRR